MKRGFSLVEMLVVIAVVLLLVALVLPVYTFVNEKAKVVQCASNLRTFHTGFMGYAADNRGNLPYYWDNLDHYNNLDATPMWWGYPAFLYIVNDFPTVNPYTGKAWSNPGSWQDFAKLLSERYFQERDIFYCQAGDNGYYSSGYERQRVYLSNYYGYFGPDGDISHAIGSKRGYQSNDAKGFNRPINLADDAGTWLLTDYNWGDNTDTRWKVATAHKDYGKNILHLDGSVIFTKPDFWVDGYRWLDKFPEY